MELCVGVCVVKATEGSLTGCLLKRSLVVAHRLTQVWHLDCGGPKKVGREGRDK